MVGGGHREAESETLGTGLERSGDGTQRKAARRAGSAIGAGIAAARDEERSISRSGQQQGGVGNTAAVRRKWTCTVQSDRRPLLSITDSENKKQNMV
jgi:hypothetical protein